jgi:hypothetical protein
MMRAHHRLAFGAIAALLSVVTANAAPTAVLQVSFVLVGACSIKAGPGTRPEIQCAGNAAPAVQRGTLNPESLAPSPEWVVYF